LCGYTTFCLSMHQWMGIWVASTCGLLWTFMPKCLCGCVFSLLSGIWTWIC
jgi:hypothetical protein